jgi:peptidoglycan/LPS O-acetylase OafA/YrhL
MNATLQSLRFVFVMMIFMSHFAYRGFTPFDAGGDCGVVFFFLLSGFTMSMGYGRSIADGSFRFSRYLKRRLLKVYPLHLLCLLLFLALFRPALDGALPVNALLLQSWIPDSAYYFSYNGVSWFLSSLLFSYLLFPIAYRKGNALVLAVLLLFCLAVYVIVPYDRINALLYVSPLVRFVDFFLGIMLYKLFRSTPSLSVPNWIELLIVALLVLALWIYPYTDEKLRNAPLYWLVLLPLIFVFARQAGPVSRLLQNSVLQWLGSLAMPIFLLHPMVFRAMTHFFPSIPTPLMLLTCFALVVALSWTIHRTFMSHIERK